MRSRIVETLPVLAARAASPGKSVEDIPPVFAAMPRLAEEVLALEPMVVSEAKGARELARVLASEKQRLEAERFTPLKGGTVYRNERMEMDGWWSPQTGWTFLKLKW